MNCPKCSAEYSEGAKFCSKCGESLAVPTPEPVPAAAMPVAVTPVVPDGPKDATPPAQAGVGDAPKGNNTVIIVLIVALVAIIGAAGTGWYMWNKGKSDPATPSSAPLGAPGQPGADGVQPGMPGMQGQSGASGAPAQQPGMPQVDEYGMPIKQSGTAGQSDAGAGSSQQSVAPAQPGAEVQQPPMPVQPSAKVPQQDVMPEPMPQEARKRRAVVENPSLRRNARMGGSIDEQYNQRAASECPAGGSGFFCREKVRYQLCNNRWSASPQPGHSICQKTN